MNLLTINSNLLKFVRYFYGVIFYKEIFRTTDLALSVPIDFNRIFYEIY